MTGPLLHRHFGHAGLRVFAQETLGGPLSADALLGKQGLEEALECPDADWSELCRSLAQKAPGLRDPIGRLLMDLRLQLPDWFTLCLCGEVEASHGVVLALHELQAPDPDPRPSLHLVEAMARVLFGIALPPVLWPSHPLVRSGVLRLEGEGPLPLRRLVVRPELWSLFCGHRSPWPGTRVLLPMIEDLPGLLRDRLPALTQLLASGQARAAVLRGPGGTGRILAATLAQSLGGQALEVPREAWESQPDLVAACRYGGWLPVVPLDLGPGDAYRADLDRLDQCPIVFLCGQDGAVEAPDLLDLTLPPLTLEERRDAWSRALQDEVAPELAEQALVDGPTIRALGSRMRLDATSRGEKPDASHLQAARARQGTERLRLLAQPVTRRVGPEALVLPPDLSRALEDLIQRCLHRERLWRNLGPSLSDPSPGVRALFAGESGSGKTLAASRLATVLGAPLFRVDLAAVMNKYIGESEKNLGKVLDEAAAVDAILLIDEADALFGRRSEGKETGERYANMLTNFLLSRIESHPGIVVLTTNARNRMDSAFSRRFDAILEFPLPGVEERVRLWGSHLGPRAPEGDFCRQLAAYCELPGGHIRNAVLHAAALDPRHGPLSPTSLVAGLREEYRKLGRPLPPTLQHLCG